METRFTKRPMSRGDELNESIARSQVFVGGNDSSAVFITHEGHRIETTWAKVFAVEEMYEALEKLLECVHDVRMMRSEYGGTVPQFEEEIEAIELLKRVRLAKTRGEVASNAH